MKNDHTSVPQDAEPLVIADGPQGAELVPARAADTGNERELAAVKCCPFCGGAATTVKVDTRPCKIDGWTDAWWVGCKESVRCSGRLPKLHKTEAEAIAAWNTRPPADPDNEGLDLTPAALATAPRAEADTARVEEREEAWLIERRVTPPQWSCERDPTGPGAFYSDPHRAHRFPSKAEAEDAMRRMSITPEERGQYFVSEHAWIDGKCLYFGMDEQEFEDFLSDTLTDSLDMDWTGSVGARAILEAIRARTALSDGASNVDRG
jgi:hypothetical protein